MKNLLPMIAVAALMSGMPTAKAQIIGPSTAATSADQVLDAGTAVLAFDFTDQINSSTTTVNNVVFSGDQTQNGVTVALGNWDSAASNGVNSAGITPSSDSTAYASILQNLLYGYEVQGGSTVTFSDLTPGTNYELQLFAGTTGANGDETVKDGTASGDLDFGTYGTSSPSDADYIMETFVAPTGGIETLDLVAHNSGYNIVNAIDLRDVAAVPEPSTYSLVALGLVMLVLLARKQRQKLSDSLA